jgi:hypothetical protein
MHVGQELKPALSILPALMEKGARIIAHDPQGMKEAAKYLPEGIAYVDNPYEFFLIETCLVIPLADYCKQVRMSFHQL